MQDLQDAITEIARMQREMRREIQCIRETWQGFNDAYLPHLKASIEREMARAKLRDAIIEKTTIGAVWACIIFLASAAWHQIAGK